MASKRLTATVSIKDIPEALAEMRLGMATLLRNTAEEKWKAGEQNIIDIAVRRSMHEVADAFEVGLTKPEPRDA